MGLPDVQMPGEQLGTQMCHCGDGGQLQVRNVSHAHINSIQSHETAGDPAGRRYWEKQGRPSTESPNPLVSREGAKGTKSKQRGTGGKQKEIKSVLPRKMGTNRFRRVSIQLLLRD